MTYRSVITTVDSYKASHFPQYPKGSRFTSAYIESRSGGDTIFFGLQAFLMDLKPITQDDIEFAATLFKAHGVPFNRKGWEAILKWYDGRLPLEIQALPEGTLVPGRIPVVQLRNTDQRFPWLTSYVETALLRSIWYPSSVATISHRCRVKIMEYAKLSMDAPFVDFSLHDFGARGVSSGESAALGGMGHLLSFNGTDTVEALIAASYYYGEPMAGFSIPAAEHSTITTWGRSREAEAYLNMLNAYRDYPMVAVVSDSYDIYNACKNIWGGTLSGEVKKLGEQGRTVVIRPDSGDPETTVLTVLDILWERFGGSINKKGYKVLPPYIRVIQGDGVNLDTIGHILAKMLRAGYSAENVVFGMGGALLQKVNRDTFAYAMKTNEIDIDGTTYDVSKSPVGDYAKRSKEGRQAVILDDDGEFQSIRETSLGFSTRNYLQPVWKNGFFAGKQQSFEGIRKLVRAQGERL